jgi:hypothetical protein
MRVAPGPVAALIGWWPVCKFHVGLVGLGLPAGIRTRFVIIPGVIVVVLTVKHAIAMVAIAAASQSHPGKQKTGNRCATKEFLDSAHFLSRRQVRLCRVHQCIKLEGGIASAAERKWAEKERRRRRQR